MLTDVCSDAKPADNQWSGDPPLLRFAAARDDRSVLLRLRVPVCAENSHILRLDSPILDCVPDGLVRLESVTSAAGFVSIKVRVASSPGSEEDDEIRFQLRASAGGAMLCHVILRRTSCRLQTALLGGPPEKTLLPQTRAALLWHGWRRCTEIVGLKRFDSGFSDTKVLVFRPRLAAPSHGGNPRLQTSSPVEVLHNSWGSWLLVKTGKYNDVQQEWQRFEAYVRDRMHPFLARSESFVAVELACDEAPGDPTPKASATLISSFVGGELIRAEPLEQAFRGCDEVGRCKQLLDRVFAVLSSWHAPGQFLPLAKWQRAFHGDPPGEWKLFGRFDLSQRSDREEYAGGLAWDSAFITERHLHRHLLGKNRDGLLYDLMNNVKACYSLTHGDLNPRNVLCEEGSVWLIDFEHTGVGPTLIDFARMEVNLRIWCLDHQSGGQDLSAAAAAFERLLLQHFHGGEGSLEPVRGMATALGADPKELLKLAHCVAHIRALATPYCNDQYADRRDYLSILYVTVLSLLRFAGKLPERAANFRVLVSMAWELERVLCHIFGRHPFETERAEASEFALLRSDWLDAPGAPGRVRYALEGDDGRRTLAPLATCRGVWQSVQHHLDVFDHTLLVLAYVEALVQMEDPVEGFLDPEALDRLVTGRLREQGLCFPAVPVPPRCENSYTHAGLILDIAREALRAALADPEAIRLLKWCALIHDVGKPGTREVDREGNVHFYGHPEYGLQLLSRHLEHLFSHESPGRLVGFDLQLMSLPNDANAIPAKGEKLIILAAVKNVLHVRIFDGDGKVVVDTDQTRLTAEARLIEALRMQLESLWPPHGLTNGDKGRVITAVRSILAHARLVNLVLRHHDHNNLAAGHPAAVRSGRLADFLADPWKAAAENRFRDAWSGCRKLIYRETGEITVSPSARGERRDDLPLLLLHGFADSLAARGPLCPLAIESRATLYLEFLAIWRRFDEIQVVADSLEDCRGFVTEKGNPSLQRVLQRRAMTSGPQLGRLREDLTRWGLERCRNGTGVPSPESFAAEAERRLGESSS